MTRTLSALLFSLLLASSAWGQTTVPGPPIGAGGTLINAINITSYGASASAADNTTGLQAAINAAVAAKQALYIPAAASCYKYTAPLTISGNLSIVGDYVSGNWNGSINVPTGSPVIVGSVLCPTANGSDAIDISGTSLQVNISNLGILFQTTFGQSSTTTGDGIHYLPGTNVQGLSAAFWQNVIVYGHDGNHYAYNIQNPIYGTFIQTFSYGGGAWNLNGNATSLNWGNMTFVEPVGQVVVGGTANGMTLTASASQRLNLITFIRPQIIVNNAAGITPGGNPPTSVQSIWSEDANVTNIRKIAPDFETNVASAVTFGPPAKGNDVDWAGAFASAASINAPAWLANGMMYGPQTRNLNDLTSSGTVALAATNAFPGGSVSATTATTYTRYATLYLGVPSAGANVTMPTPESLYALGAIFTNSNIASAGGAFLNGTTQINTNNGASTTEIGDGTTTGQITIGGSAGKVALNGAIADSGYDYQTPATGGAVTLSNTKYHEIIDPAGTLATLTVNLPPAPIDGQYVDVRFSQIITALTVSGNGHSVAGNPTSAAVGSQFGCIYRNANTTWYC
jgi:hypothetical protein